MQRVSQARQEIETNARPRLKSLPERFDTYDTVFLCFPIWWFTIPMPVATFLGNLDWSGKRLIPVNTSNSSGTARSTIDIQKLCPKAIIQPGLELQGPTVEMHMVEIKTWAVRKISG